MIRFHPPLIVLAAAGLIVATASTPAQTPASKAYLLNVSKGQTFTDIGSDDKTKPELVEDFKELGGKALKVAFFKGDSVGDRVAKVKNWKPFATLRVNVFNPGKDTVKLGLNIFHARSTNYDTRIEVPVVLKPGKNEVAIGIDELQNTNGSAPALTDIRRWYFADAEGKGPTLYFGDMVLEGADARGGPRRRSAAGDPARLKRIRAARMPRIDKPILFDTPEADAIVSALEVFPPDNPWNLVVEDWPVHPNSKNIIELDRREQEAPLQLRHGLRPGAARPEEDRRQARLGLRRVGQGPLPGAGQHADRRLPDQLQGPDPGRSAAQG